MMSLIPKRAILVIGGLILMATGIRAQKNHFLYIQSENNHPFYIKLDNKVFSSSEAGYLIIPKLVEGSYVLVLGFPRNEWPPQQVTCVVKDVDAGYQLRDFGQGNWGLADLQTKHVVMAKKLAPAGPETSSDLVTDSFSIILASVVNDKGLLKKRETALDTIASTLKKEVLVPVEKESRPVLVEAENSKAQATTIKRFSRETGEAGVSMSFLEISDGKVDTISILIPLISPEKDSTKTVKSNEGQGKDTAEEKEYKFLNMEFPNPNLQPDSLSPSKDSTAIMESKISMVGAKCGKIATDKDFLNLRKSMAVEKNELGMITVALKKFRSVCFSTEQIRNLGNLFLNEEGKYKLYVAAFPFVSDLPSFGSLESELNEEYYISRFRAMLNQK